MLKLLDLSGVLEPRGRLRDRQLRELLPRPIVQHAEENETVRAIVADVRLRGDAAVLQWTEQLDAVVLSTLQVPASAIDGALRNISPLLREALEVASTNITSFQRLIRPEEHEVVQSGIQIRETWKPVERVGCYVPGGNAMYPSTVLMTAIPARVAGVERVAMCIPPNSNGVIPDEVLAAAALCEIDEVYSIGGPQAIAAMAYGTESIDAVDVICGSGGTNVTMARRLVSDVVGVSTAYSGPSEVVIVADETTPANVAAIDLAAQAERGIDGLAWLVTWSQETANRVNTALQALMAESDSRARVAAALESGGYCVLVEDAQAAMDVVNAVAPEHLEIMTVDPEALVPLVRHAGAVFAGEYSPASIGNYFAGPSHVLPAGGFARFSSALSVRDFQRAQHVITMNQESLTRLDPHVRALGEVEGLLMHAESARMRFS